MGAPDFAGLPHIGEALKRKEDYRFLTGAGQYTDDIDLANQATRCSCDPRTRTRRSSRRHAEAMKMRRGGDLHRRRPRGRERIALRLAHHQRRRHADEGAAALGARQGQGALRRRPRRAGDRGEREPGEGRRRADRSRLRGAARGRESRGRAQVRRAADPRGSARQQVLHLGARRQGGGRRGVREGGARHEDRHRQQPAVPNLSNRALPSAGTAAGPRSTFLVPAEPASSGSGDGFRARLARAQGEGDRSRCGGFAPRSFLRGGRLPDMGASSSTAASSGPASVRSASCRTRTGATM